MLENWLNIPSSIENFPSSDLGHRIFLPVKASNHPHQLYIIGDGSAFAKQTCNALAEMKDHFNKTYIKHLGDLKNNNADFVIPVIKEALNFPGKVLFVSQDDHYINSIFRVLEPTSTDINLGYINNRLDWIQEHKKGLLKSERLYNLSCLGFQRHFCSLDNIEFLNNVFINHRSYGEVVSNLEQVEPITRAISGLVFSGASLNSSFYRHLSNNSPNGFTGLEACQIAKYCGMSQELRLINFNNAGGETSNAHLTAQMIWYFIEGMALEEKMPKSGKSQNYQEHLVRSDFLHTSLRFVKSMKSNRWWFEIPSESKEGQSNLYPCSYEDYRLATNNELSDFILAQINHDH